MCIRDSAYGTYDLTNQATLKNWSTTLSVIDMGWGTVLTAVSAVIAYIVVSAIVGRARAGQIRPVGTEAAGGHGQNALTLAEYFAKAAGRERARCASSGGMPET